ncbi:MAG TPA: hydroxyacid dehydrogenase, partial [Spirochaetota bacterium]|nr:hydroxyacid dehydrogenase [Spirochaetota bacterium]
MKQKIVISDTIADEGIAVLNESKLFDVFYKPGITPGELMKELHTAHGLIVRSATKVTAELIDAAPELQVIARAGIGLDNVDIERATEKGIVVMNTPAGNTISTAEHTIAMLLSLVRQIPGADNSMKQGKWEKNRFQGTELRGKVIAVIGLGRVGLEVARRCKGLSMRVAGYDPFISKDSKLNVDLEFPDIDDIWRTADFITVHTPLNDQTKNLINKSVISKMKSSVRLINCARGGIINETDLYNALKNGEIAGAALDVFTEEPPSSLPPFHELANVVLTPHLGASTGEAQVSVAVEAAEIVAEFLTTGIARNSINLPSLDIHELAFLKPYIDLAEKIGR